MGAPVGPGGVPQTTPPQFAYAVTDGEHDNTLTNKAPGSMITHPPASTRVSRVDNISGIGMSRRLAVRSVQGPPRRVEPRSSWFQPFLVYPLRWNTNLGKTNSFGRITRPRNLGLTFKVEGMQTGQPKNTIAIAQMGAPVMTGAPRYLKVIPLKQATARPSAYTVAGAGN